MKPTHNVAQIRTDQALGPNSIIFSSINVSGDIIRDDYQWFIDEALCDRVPLTYDKDGLPKLWQVFCEVKPNDTGIYEIVASVNNRKANFPKISDPKEILVLHYNNQTSSCYLIDDGKFTERYGHFIRSRQFGFFRQKEKPLLDVKVYRTQTKFGSELCIEISNQKDELLVESLLFKRGGQTFSIIPKSVKQYLFKSKTKLHKRFYFGKQPIYARAVGVEGFQYHGFGAEDQGIPEITKDYVAYGYGGRNAILYEKLVETCTIRNAIISGIGPTIDEKNPAYCEAISNSQIEIDLLKLKHECIGPNSTINYAKALYYLSGDRLARSHLIDLAKGVVEKNQESGLLDWNDIDIISQAFCLIDPIKERKIRDQIREFVLALEKKVRRLEAFGDMEIFSDEIRSKTINAFFSLGGASGIKSFSELASALALDSISTRSKLNNYVETLAHAIKHSHLTGPRSLRFWDAVKNFIGSGETAEQKMDHFMRTKDLKNSSYLISLIQFAGFLNETKKAS